MHIATNNLINAAMEKYTVQLFILTYCTDILQQYIRPSEHTIAIPVCSIHRMPLCRSSTVHQITNLLSRHDLGFCNEVVEYCALPDYSAASSGNFLPTFQDHLLVPSYKGQESNPFFDSWPLKMGLIGCLKTSVRNYHYSLHNNPEECNSYWPCNDVTSF